ncbi:MAG: NAD-dependent epimerase/dehydratase [uncultured bacterium]|uniref:NAD-dependent epimerase/dehydratase n=1 Tax=Candidatus Daviesbacteria bacterium GW2011_GWC2_40_12 TaxID=1618431 RepID=A0A0G0QQF4_9BACT|nr:MAG: NAD-dependent epimerase/dehydratase [uncultured bacterium]KKR17250.1 MAG: NAD-dependent epimerase/dehydratase [Candidatus Daviesbacteria bacterium GW2011_GWA2_39_33]KKR42649.1 MAG: NAD-dependent epimerase/dehydratase [Candidatus Daviesbacteria bacterium GW2011_GWC2_40_12]OGE21324.1 MAG: hypothetical protein A2778_04110 [Candidatus Daviesbacteria bacterium RIFCSPHIGHO2_01_FULL_40_24]OGE30158.1 MAG: hypothetical protein A3C29_02010 [Candidatus Daviesbacteria bacterium RIFCSPHIGHO2_02_FULL
MNILITGGSGFVGSHLLKRLILTNHKIFIIKRNSSDLWRIKSIAKKINILEMKSFKDLSHIFAHEKFDLIIHLAMKYVKSDESWQDAQEINEVNITYPSILLMMADQYKTKAFINTGTCFEYNLSNNPLSETDFINPYNYYASTKVAFEDIFKFYILHGKILGLTLKLSYPYGEMDNKKVIPLIIKSIITNTPLELTYGEQKLGFTYVEDIIDAYLQAINFIAKDKLKSYEVFNIGANNTYQLKEIVGHLEKISGKKSLISFSKPYPPNEIMHISCNFEKAKKILNWFPKTDIIEGLTKTYQYYQTK